MGCGLDSGILSAAQSDLFLTFPSQVSNPSSGIIGDDEVRAVAPRLKETIAVPSARRKATAWEIPLGLDAT